MKNFFTFCFLCLCVVGVRAQTVAQDWTRTDCDGTSYNLFTDCDSGNVVIMEFVMMNCSSCVTAAKGLHPIVTDYETSHPGKVKIYSISYNNTTTCTSMQNWKKTSGATWPVFTNGASDISYYGGFGMPTIVIVGGKDKTIYFQKMGYSTSDNATIRKSIDDAIGGTASVKNVKQSTSLVSLYPNPASNLLRFTLGNDLVVSSVKVFSMTGAEVLSANHLSSNELNISSLSNGVYYVSLTTADGSILTRQFTVTR